jgi:N-acetyl-anhydromuramyl-L-alanine amidase AmpD
MTDYPGAIWFPAHPTNYRVNDASPNTPKGFVLHTPQEPADSWAYTPRFFADPNRDASTHYFVGYDGDVYQCVAEKDLAIANGVIGKPYPSWGNPARSLNWQSLSVEIEGYAENLHETMPIGSRQWNALVALVRDRCVHYGIPLDRWHIIGHYAVANNRSDPGSGFPWGAFIAALQEEDMAERVWDGARTWIVGKGGASPIEYPAMDKPLEAIYGPHARLMTLDELDAIKV